MSDSDSPTTLPVCPTCGGAAIVCGCERGKWDVHPQDIHHTVFLERADGVPCPNPGCVDGVVLSDELEEAVMVAYYMAREGDIGPIRRLVVRLVRDQEDATC